jgi:tRNA-2-methylthio-N6-dimethylallyladenosine synthase
LKRMNRSHTTDSYLKVIEKIRAARPDIVLSGDFITGFPEETEEDFQSTLDLVEAVKYGYAYSFKYSTRPGTPAAERAQVPEDVKSDRLQRLQSLITKHQRAIQDAMIGRVVSVLIEKEGRHAGQVLGKSEYLHSVHLAGPDLAIGDIARVRIIGSKTNSLTGETV